MAPAVERQQAGQPGATSGHQYENIVVTWLPPGHTVPRRRTVRVDVLGRPWRGRPGSDYDAELAALKQETKDAQEAKWGPGGLTPLHEPTADEGGGEGLP